MLFGTPYLHPSAGESLAVFRRLGSSLASRAGGVPAALELLGAQPRVPLWQKTALLEGVGAPVSGYAAGKENPAAMEALEALIRSEEREVAVLAVKLKKKLQRAESKP
jgi:hypothetical protein